jgi:hypothetical protein
MIKQGRQIMRKSIQVISTLLALTGSAYLPSAIAQSTDTHNTTSSTDMLITLAETDAVLIEQLNELALNDAELLTQLLTMAESNQLKLARLLTLAQNNPSMFWVLANIYNSQANTQNQQATTLGAIDDGAGIIRN